MLPRFFVGLRAPSVEGAFPVCGGCCGGSSWGRPPFFCFGCGWVFLGPGFRGFPVGPGASAIAGGWARAPSTGGWGRENLGPGLRGVGGGRTSAPASGGLGEGEPRPRPQGGWGRENLGPGFRGGGRTWRFPKGSPSGKGGLWSLPAASVGFQKPGRLGRYRRRSVGPSRRSRRAADHQTWAFDGCAGWWGFTGRVRARPATPGHTGPRRKGPPANPPVAPDLACNTSPRWGNPHPNRPGHHRGVNPNRDSHPGPRGEGRRGPLPLGNGRHRTPALSPTLDLTGQSRDGHSHPAPNR
ncbi:hypothetical protein SUDANB121_03353 [Nocardiopsis dassonvillei]